MTDGLESGVSGLSCHAVACYLSGYVAAAMGCAERASVGRGCPSCGCRVAGCPGDGWENAVWVATGTGCATEAGADFGRVVVATASAGAPGAVDLSEAFALHEELKENDLFDL